MAGMTKSTRLHQHPTGCVQVPVCAVGILHAGGELNVPHSFHAYIDESGDEGFKFKDPPERGSSEWFLLSAVIVRETRLAAASRLLNALIGPIEERRKAPIHFTNLNHDQQVGVIHGMAKMPVRLITVCVNKRQLGGEHGLGRDRRLYFYCVRFLLERISWLTRDRSVAGEGNGRCRLTFSACKGLSYANLSEYLGVLAAGQSQVAWDHVDIERIKVQPHNESIWLRTSDAAVSGFARALELSPHGLCEDRFARLLRPVVYCYQEKYLSYGVKLFPSRPAVEAERDNRYQWLSLYE
jgi:hypothetical protein